MTDSKVLLELAARCEKAEGPDRRLDAGLHQARGYTLRDGKPNERYAKTRRWVSPEGIDCGWLEGTNREYPPRYTASVDAALTLVAGTGVLITLSEIKGDGMPMCVVGNPETAELFEAVANTMPLALVAAALRSHAAQDKVGDGE